MFTAEQEIDIITQVREEHPDIGFPDVFRSPMWYGRMGKQQVDDWSVIIGRVPVFNEAGFETDEFVDEAWKPCSKEYQLVRHEVALHLFEKAMESEDIKVYGQCDISVELINGGRRCYITADFPECKEELKPGRPLTPKAGVRNSNDLTLEFSRWFGAMELVCANGMVAFKINQSASKKHRQNLDIDFEIKGVIEGMNDFAEQTDIWKNWVDVQLASADAEVIMAALPFGSRHNEEILALPETGTGDKVSDWLAGGKVNLYDMYGIYTQFLTHNVESDMVRVTKGEEVARVFHNYEQVLQRSARKSEG